MYRGWSGKAGSMEDGASRRGNSLSEGVAASVSYTALSVPGLVPGTYWCSAG